VPVGSAHSDETNTASHNGPRVGLVNVGQVDDPMEDVLEHLLLIGDGYSWNRPATPWGSRRSGINSATATFFVAVA